MYHYQGCAHSGQQQPPLNKMTTTTTRAHSALILPTNSTVVLQCIQLMLIM